VFFYVIEHLGVLIRVEAEQTLLLVDKTKVG